MRPVRLERTVILLSRRGKSDKRKIEGTRNVWRGASARQMRFIRADQAGVVSVQPAEGVVSVEVPVIAKPLLKDDLEGVINANRIDDLVVAGFHKERPVQPRTGISDDIGFAVLRISNARILDHLIHILVRISRTEEVI